MPSWSRDNVLGTLAARLSFFNLSRRQALVKSDIREPDVGIWALSGFSGEWVTGLPPDHGYRRVKLFRGMHGVAPVSRAFKHGDFDYLACEVLYNDFYQGPDSYGGFSGGGLWHHLVKIVDGAIAVTDRILSGVAFFELPKSGEGDQTTRQIICHGPEGIYRNLVGAVRAGKWD